MRMSSFLCRLMGAQVWEPLFTLLVVKIQMSFAASNDAD